MVDTASILPPVYTHYFEFLRVAEGELLDAVFRIRFQVYCEERRFLDPGLYPERKESDRFDETAVHFVGRHRFRFLPAGTARLVLPSDRGFPLQGHCRFDPEHGFLCEPGHPKLSRYAEISRVAVSKAFRKRLTDTLYGGPPRHEDNLPDLHLPPEPGNIPAEAGPEIVAGLFKSLYQEAKRRRLAYFVVAMERSLEIMLRRMGIRFRPVGPVSDYFGPVRPYAIAILDLEHDLHTQRRAVFDYWMDGLEPENRPALAMPEEQPTMVRAPADGPAPQTP